MPNALNTTTPEYEFHHPHGTFALRLQQLTGDVLAHLLLSADDSYITVAANDIAADDLPLVVRLVKLGARLTKGIGTLSQFRRERARIGLQQVHDALLARGYTVLTCAMDRAVILPGGFGPTTAYVRVVGVVIHNDAREVEARLFLPGGKVATRDEGVIAPARAVELVA
jgi:hypothetical protein